MPEPSTSRASAASRAWRAPKGQWSRDWLPARPPSSMRTTSSRACGARSRRRAWSRSGCASRRTSARPRCTPRSDRRGSAPSSGSPPPRAALRFKRGASGAWLIDDSYNANPSSVRAAIEVLGSLAGRKWLVLGDMAELGEFALQAHSAIGEFARAQGVERLYATGSLAVHAVDCFGAGAQWFADAAALTAALTRELGKAGPEVRLLIKGSRVNRLERVVDALAADSTANTGGH